MLSSILPGVRQSRAELASGALWLCTIWVASGGCFIGAVESTSSESIRLLVSRIDGLTGLAVVAVLSYLIGTMWNAAIELIRVGIWSAYIRRNPEPKMVPKSEMYLYYLGDFWRPYSYRSHSSLIRMLRDSDGVDHDNETFNQLVTAVLYEALYVGPAILRSDLGAVQEIYSEYIRAKSEGEMRDAIAIPLFVSSLVVVWNVEFSIFVSMLATGLAAVVSVGLFLMARRSTRNANSQVLYWVSNRHVTTAALRDAVDSDAGHD